MIVECIRILPSPEDAARLGKHYLPGRQEFPVEVGRQYTVYGIRLWDRGIWVDIAVDAGYLVVVPLCLFTIVDGRVPSLWEVRLHDDGDLAMLPPAFHGDYFHDDLTEGVSEAVREFLRVKRLLENDVSVQRKPDFS